MTLGINNYGSLVESDGRGITWIIAGLKCDLSKYYEDTLVLNYGFMKRPALGLGDYFSFTLAINDYKK